jgi:hypothetical protein
MTQPKGMIGMSDGTIKGAEIDPTGMYRYSLWRIWDSAKDGHLVFVMLNPSKADADLDDPTIRRCIGFAKTWGFGSIEVVNLFAFRATDPSELKKCKDPIGPHNNKHIHSAAARATKIVFAWGVNGTLLSRDKQVINLLSDYNPVCLQKSKAGHPKHPLYIAANCEPIFFGGTTS